VALKAQRLLGAAADTGLLRRSDTDRIVAEARRARRDPVDVATSTMRLPLEAFYRALAQQLGLPFVEAAELRPDPALVARLPASLLQRRRVLPLREEEGAVLVVVGDPEERSALQTLERRLGRPLRLALADPGALETALRHVAAPAGEGGEGGDGAALDWDPVAFLDRLLQQAYLRRASDVHLDPQEDGLRIRIRVDGRLQPYGAPLTRDEAALLLTRVKVLGGLDIAERREPQDGGYVHRLGEPIDDDVDIRLATIPTRHGERATLRLLGIETRELTLDRLGFGDGDLERFRAVLQEPHGLVLLTGPTGSGKSTTLYAALREVADPARNVVTVEDPIEFVIDGITQVPIDRVGKVTFAGALRSILRHDPDVIMVGEVRDAETADVALKAAMTGHLVLSSLHTNRATTAVGRLVDIGCEPYLVAATLRAAIAQRLVRRLCARCRVARPAAAEELAPLGGEGPAEVHGPGGCPACVGTGYQGRVALAECLWVDDALAAAVARRTDEEGLRRLARARGFRTLREQGLARVLAGETSLDEALLARV